MFNKTQIEALKEINSTIPRQTVINYFNENDIDYTTLTDIEMYIQYMEAMNQCSHITSNKKFIWKDKTGRGITTNLTMYDIQEDINDYENYDGDSVKEWAMEAENGDEFESRTEKYICTQS